MGMDDLDADRREPTMTLTGWRKFVDTPPAQRELLPEDQWRDLSDAERESYDEARINYHSELVAPTTDYVILLAPGTPLTPNEQYAALVEVVASIF